MKGRFRPIGLFIVCVLIGTMVPAGRGERAALALETRPDLVQGVMLASPPVPLPHDCDGVTPPGEDPPACCAYGYVYYDGVPVTGASVHIESPYGALDTTTASGGASSEPYYSIDLSSAPLLVSPGDIITVTATYEGDNASTVYEVAPDGQQVDIPIIINVVPLFGDGSDGDLVVESGREVVINTVRANVTASGTSAAPAHSDGFSAGDVVLFHQTQGTSNAGCWEFNRIAAVNSPTNWTLAHPLACTYDNTSGRAQVVKVPQYRNVTINGGGTLTMPAWDGNTGGILSFYASGTVVVNGTIGADGSAGGSGTGDRCCGAVGGGFRGGNNSTDGSAAEWGESYDGTFGFGQEGREANYSGGGGADGWARCGGGGGNGSVGISGWPNDDSGGYGLGGGISGNVDLSRMLFGGGGGGGRGSDAGGGGSGGGIVILIAKEIDTASGYVTAQGGSGGGRVIIPGQTAAGGAGAGGSIFLRVNSASLGTERVLATGGGVDGATEGRGGVGRVRIEYGTLSGSTNPPASTQERQFHTAPIPTIHTVYPNPAVQGQDTITFRGSAVDNDEDGASITQYVWRSDLDGLLSTQATFTRAASSLSAGTHTIYFKARDDEGEWSDEVSTTLTVNPAQGSPPTASFTVNPTGGDTATVFNFDASGCSDAEDPVTALEVRWDWTDDGTYDTGWSTTKTASHIYSAAGIYTIRLEVRDTDGMTESTTRTVTVNPAGETAWAFLLYLDGDNNLSSWMQRALDNLEAATANQDVTVLALLDGYGNGNTWRYHVQPGGDYTDGVNRWYMGELDMSNPQTLSDFVTWARDNYPAEHYYLAVADHGRGTTGIAWDDASGNGQFITVAELRTALRDATSDGAEPLDVVHYDACLMGMVENAYQIKDYAGYLIASENLGWSIFAYDRYAAGVTATTTPEQLATVVVDEYYNALAGYPRTIAALNLGQAGAVEDAVTALATVLQASLDANKYYVRNTRDATQKFDSRDYFVIDINDEYLDLYDLARLIKQNVPGDDVKDAAQGVMDAVSAFVVAERHESGYYRDHPYWDLDDAHGVSIYFPPASSGWGYNDYMSHVFRFTVDGQWDEFLQAYYGLMGLPPETPTDPGVPPVLNRPYSVYLPVVIR